MQTLWQDLRYSVRMLMKRPGFALIAVITLALGMGANTAIFSVVNAVLVRPLPYPEPDRLMTFWVTSSGEGLRKMEWTEGLVAHFRERTQAFENIAAYDGGSGFNLTGRGEPRRLSGTTVTHDFFRVLRQNPLHGRTFLPQEDTRGNSNVTILSYDLWRRQFGSDPAIVGQSLILNNVPTVVTGIMPAGFDFPNGTDLWVPVGLDPQDFNQWYIEPIGRLKPGVTMANAQREIDALWNGIARERNYPSSGPDFILSVTPLMQLVVGRARTPLLVLLGAVALVLLIACANVANLLLAKATARRREIAVRCCLGASPWRIVRQLLAESMLLSLIGCGVGVLLALWGVEGFKRLAATDASRIEQLDLLAVPLPRIEQVQVNLKMLVFSVAVAVLTGLLFGLAPALRASRSSLNEAMKEGGPTSASVSSQRLNNAFVIAQVAISLVLLVGTGLLLRSFRNLLSVDPGFRPENVWVGRLDLPTNRYKNDTEVRRFYGQLLERVHLLPGIRTAGLCQRLPFFGGGDGNVFAAEGHELRPDKQAPTIWWRDVSTGYFAAMGIPILQGRPFQESDTDTSPRVAIVDEKLAHTFWPSEDPIGKRIHFAWGGDWMTVVGVAASVKHASLDEDSRPYVYWPVSQDVRSSMYLVLRTSGAPEGLTAAVRSQLSTLDAELPLFEVTTMERAVARSLSTRRFTNLLVACFGATALMLAMIGLYGVMALNVSSRTNEFGIRLALGAQASDVVKLVMGRAVRLTLTGVVIGSLASLALMRLMRNLLFGIGATDPLTFGAAVVLLIAVALVACWAPVRRAAKVDPLMALRYE